MEREEIRKKINSLFDNNQLDDLQRFLRKRQNLNGCNVYMLYLFHFIQSIGILVTSYGTSVNDTNIIWSGVSLNVLASLIQIYEKINNSQLKKLMNDIKAIKEDKYVDESPMVDPEKDLESGMNRTHTMMGKEQTTSAPSPRPSYISPTVSKSSSNSQMTVPLLQTTSNPTTNLNPTTNTNNYQSINI